MMQQVSKRGWTRAIALFVALLMSFGIMSARAKVALASSVIDGVEITGVKAPSIGETAKGYTKATVRAYYGSSADLPKNVEVKWYDEKDTDQEFTGKFEEDSKYIAVVEFDADVFGEDSKFSKSPTITWDGESTPGLVQKDNTFLRVLKEYHTAPFTITFDYLTSQTPVKQIVGEGMAVEFPDNSDKFFLGWMSSETGSTHFKKGDGQVYIPTNDVTFVADYGETRTITFHANYPTSISDEVKSVQVQYGSSYTLSRMFSENSLLGYYIIGWSTENDDTPEYAYNGTISSVTEDMNLWAVWSYSGGGGYYPIYEGDITLVFHSNHSNATGSMSNQTVSYSSANTTRINRNQFKINNNNSNNNSSNNNNNNNFIGWTVETPNYSGNSNGSYNYNYNSRLISDEAYVSTALNAYFSYYNGNGRYYNGNYYNGNNRYYNYGNRYYTGLVGLSEDEEALTAQDEGGVVVEEEDPELIAQREFAGFLSGLNSYAGSLLDYYNNYYTNWWNGNYAYEYDYIIDLYAQWNDNNNNGNVTITYNSNGGVGTMSDQTIQANTSTALKTNTFTRTGYEFTGWNTNANGTGTDYTNGQNVSLSSSITLYAQWKTVETPVTPTPTETPTTTPTTPTATTGAVATTTTPVPTYATTTTTPAVLAATADPTTFIGVVTASVAGLGATFAGIRSKKHSKR